MASAVPDPDAALIDATTAAIACIGAGLAALVDPSLGSEASRVAREAAIVADVALAAVTDDSEAANIARIIDASNNLLALVDPEV